MLDLGKFSIAVTAFVRFLENVVLRVSWPGYS